MSDSVKKTICTQLKDSLYWWLGRKKPFIVNNEYKIELLHIDRNHYSAKIRITNLKNNEVFEVKNDNK
jgi:hypothetical protein